MQSLIVTLLLSVVMSIPQGILDSMPKQVMNTTHRIEMHVEGEGDVCSSTAIAPHALLTATHCDLGAPTVIVDGKETDIVKRIKDDNDHTIYIVTLKFKDYAQFSKDAVKVGDEVWLRGNPDGLNQLVRRGIYSGSVLADGQTVEMFDVNGWHGDSGSAVFDKHGKIVAVVTYGFSDGGFDMLGCLIIRFTPEQLKQAGVTN